MVLYCITPLPSSLHIRVLLVTYTLSISAYIHCIVSAPMPLSPIPVIVVFRRHGTASINLCISRRLCPRVGDPGLQTEYKRDNNEGARWRTRADSMRKMLRFCHVARVGSHAQQWRLLALSHASATRRMDRDLVHAAFVQTTMR